MPYINGYLKFEDSELNQNDRVRKFEHELAGALDSTLQLRVETNFSRDLVRDGRSVLSELQSDLFIGDRSFEVISVVTQCVIKTNHLPQGTTFDLFAPHANYAIGRVRVGGEWDPTHRDPYDLTNTRLQRQDVESV